MNELLLQYSLHNFNDQTIWKVTHLIKEHKITIGSYQGECDYKTFSLENQLKSVSRVLGKRKKQTDYRIKKKPKISTERHKAQNKLNVQLTPDNSNPR